MNDEIRAAAGVRDQERPSEEVVGDPLSIGAAVSSDAVQLIELDTTQWNAIERSVPGGRDNVQDVYPLSPLQEGMLFHRLLNEQHDTYVLSVLFELQSAAQVIALREALQHVVARHDVLRTAILWEGLSRPVQVVQRTATLRIRERAFDPDASVQEQVDEWIKPYAHKLDLAKAPLVELGFATAPNGRAYAVLHVHHLICDHQSLQAIVGEAIAILAGRGAELPQPAAYRDYMAYALTRADTEAAKSFFSSKLQDVEEPTAPFGLLDVREDRTQMAEAVRPLEAELAECVRATARNHGVSVARVFHAAWALVVAQTSGCDDIVFGTVLLAAGQRAARAQRMLGMTVNTLPLRFKLDGQTARGLLDQTNRELVELLRHEQTPLALAQRCSGIATAMPLFTALLNYRRSATPSDGTSGAAGIRMLARGEAWTNYPITLIVDDFGDTFTLTAQTDSRIDANRLTAYLCEAVRSLADALARAPETLALDLSIVPVSERRQIMESFNPAPTAYPHHKLIHELFEAQVERTPHARAVVCGERYLTYRQLNCRANQLARYLRERGAGRDRFVGICVERGMDMIIGLFGILKSGAAYVPLDPNYPRERLEYMVRETAPVAILTSQRTQSVLPDGAPAIPLDTHWNEIARLSVANLARLSEDTTSADLAYVIYTSGSTGKPKGVAIEHRNAINLIHWAECASNCEVFEETLQATSLNFDLSVYECFVPLTTGGSIRVVRDALAVVGEPPGVTMINTVPSAVRGILDLGGIPATTRVVNVAGEPLKRELVEQMFAQSAVKSVCNLYGPSETTTYSTYVSMSRDTGFIASIGRPIANTQVYILDRRRHLVPVGVVGEIYIGGAGVARGYLHRPDLTAERFLGDPFSVEPAARMYKTGDLGRWLVDGTIEYLGRNDQQVKVRGFRIELGEIEARLLTHEQIREAVVVARQDAPGEQRLVAYVVADVSVNSSLPRADVLRSHLQQTLPEYMVPSAFVILERMPLTQSGKVDRNALPLPSLEAYASRQYEAPQGEVEESLAAIWQKLLGVDQVGRDDNFFELGGHSLLVVQMMERLRRIGLRVDVRQVFASSTLRQLAVVLDKHGVEQTEPVTSLIPPGCTQVTTEMLPLVSLSQEHIEVIVASIAGGAANIQDIYPLAPLQEGILFHYLMDTTGGDPYVVPMLLSVAHRERLDQLVGALQAVIDRHDVLRTALLWEHLPRPVQVVQRRALLRTEEVALDPTRDVVKQVEDWLAADQQRLDIRQAPLLRLRVAADPHSDQWYVLLQLHHLVADNASQELVISEVVAHLEGRGRDLPQAIPYRAHVAQSLAYRKTQDAEVFFGRMLGDVDEPTAPFALLDVRGDGSNIDEAYLELELALAQRLRAQARRLAVSAATLFHAAWALVVSHTSGRDDVVFGSVLLGRLHGSAGAQRTVGAFINTLPLRLRLRSISARELIEHTQRQLIELLRHEQAPLAIAQRCSGLQGTIPLFSALLNYRHNASRVHWSNASGIRALASRNRTNYPFMLSVDDLGAGFGLTAQTDKRIDPRRLTDYMHVAVLALVDALESSPQTPALSLSILGERERHQVLDTFNPAPTAYPQEKPIHTLFEEQAQRSPDALAVVYQESSLTYAQLNSRANQLAHHLIRSGITAGQLVGVCLERSAELLVALLGILKAGGAYVPLDPSYPPERLLNMIADAEPRVVLTAQALLPKLQGAVVPSLALDSAWREIAAEGTSNPDAAALGLQSDALAYVIYTSGSTGQPKGVMIEHQSVVNLWSGLEELYQRSAPACARVALNASINFDASVQQLVQLLSGRAVVVVPQACRQDPREFLRFLAEQRIDACDCTPSQLKAWIAAGLLDRPDLALRVVLVGGEAIDPEMWRALSRSQRITFFNVYGPTECTVDSTAARLNGDAAAPHIGRPMRNRRVYILNASRQPAPLGVVGEVYIGGVGVARGYLRRQTLTTERFIADPFSPQPQARMYKTGDLGRWREDGTIEYLGRNDQQVKIRGFRIELGEIEAQLERHHDLKQVAVIVREDVPGDRRLVAYLTARNPAEIPDVEYLRASLKAVLPEHMVPSAFVIVDKLPITPSGKLDRGALPVPELQAYTSRRYEAPEGELELAVAEMWGELLGIDRIGRNDDFFELGGHSLLAMQLTAHLQSDLSVEIPIRAVFELPTLRDLARKVGELREERLAQAIAHGGDELHELLAKVASMPEARVRELLRELEAGGRS